MVADKFPDAKEDKKINLRDFSKFEKKNTNANVPDKIDVVDDFEIDEDNDNWQEVSKYKSTNVFGIPKKKPYSEVKQEWPPKEINDQPLMNVSNPLKSSDTNSSVPANIQDLDASQTNVFNLPKNFSRNQVDSSQGWYKEKERPDYLTPKDDEETNALGIPKHWYERQQAEEKRKEEKNKEPHITQEEIDNIKKTAHDEGYDAGYQEGLKTGYDEGFRSAEAEGRTKGLEDGYAEGILKAKNELQEKIDYFSSIVNQLAAPRNLLDDSISDALVNLAINIAQQLVPVCIDRSKKYIVDNLNQALSLLPTLAAGVTIVVNSHDANIINSVYSQEYLTEKKWNIIVNDSLNNGDLQIEAKDSSLSVSTEQQILNLIKGFIAANINS